MATDQTFANMINEYAPNKLLMEELKKRNFLLQNIEHDKSWKLGNYIVPFLGNVGSSVKFGSMTAESDIGKETTVRGVISAYKEMWGSMVFEAKDLMINDKVSEQNLLRLLPDAIDRHSDYINQVLGQNLMTSKYIDVGAASGTSGGLLQVKNPERFVNNQKVQILSSAVAAVTGYIKSIDINLEKIHVVTTRGGGTDVDLSAYLLADGIKVYNDTQATEGFTSLLDAILPASAGGAANLYGVSKLEQPYTQSIAIDGSTFVAANLLKEIFKAYVQIRKKGEGKPFKVLMSYRNMGVAVQNLESSKGAFNVVANSDKAQQFGWTEISIGGFAGVITLVALQEMNDSEIIFFDPSSTKMVSNGGLRKQKSPEGLEYFTVRNTTGYRYIIDTCLMGELVVVAPKKNGSIYGLALTY